MASRGSVNKVILIGTVGAEPALKSFASGGSVLNVRIATNEAWKDKQSGEQKESTEWHNLVMRNKLAEIGGQYLRKGSKIYVEGSLRTRKWADSEGKDRYTTEIQVLDMQMLDSKSDSAASFNESQGSRPSASSSPRVNPPQNETDQFLNDVPF